MKVITRLLLVMALMLMGLPTALAANRELKGTVVDSENEPLIGVSVQVLSEALPRHCEILLCWLCSPDRKGRRYRK